MNRLTKKIDNWPSQVSKDSW